jgi:hypothetical protein
LFFLSGVPEAATKKPQAAACGGCGLVVLAGQRSDKEPSAAVVK